MRRILPVAVLLLASAASAQESQEDIGTRIVREQEELRRRQMEKVGGAPARAIDHGMRDPATDVPSPPPVRLEPPRPVSSMPTWLIALLVALPVVFFLRSAWRRAGRP